MDQLNQDSPPQQKFQILEKSQVENDLIMDQSKLVSKLGNILNNLNNGQDFEKAMAKQNLRSTLQVVSSFLERTKQQKNQQDSSVTPQQ